jgi:hypothetical protein
MDNGCFLHKQSSGREGHLVVFSHYSREQSSQDTWTAAADVGEADISSLLEMLGSVVDPRKERGKQHELDFVLAVCVVATLAGARGYSEIARKARDMPSSLLGKLGSEWDWFKSRYKFPSKGTIRVVLSGINGNDMDGITGEWLSWRASITVAVSR